MGDGFPFFDILLFAMVAAFQAWLSKSLGVEITTPNPQVSK